MLFRSPAWCAGNCRRASPRGSRNWAGSTAWIQVMFNRSTPQDDVWVSKLPAQMAKVKVKKATAWMFAGAD